jgi:CMD domain protein
MTSSDAAAHRGADVIDELAGLGPDSALAVLRRTRPEIVAHLQASDRAVFAPRCDGGLAPAERAALAMRIAVALRDAELERHYRARLAALEADGAVAPARDERWRTVLAHVERVTLAPDSARRGHIEDLLGAGLSPRAVVALSQLIAYVNFQSRLLAGLRALGGTR